MAKAIFVIAEAGVNHNGNLAQAIELVDVALAAGADAVKFQTFKAESLVTKTASKANYQKQTTGVDQSQLAMLKDLELSYQQHFQLRDYCEQRGIIFMSSAFDVESLDFLVTEVGVKPLKIASGEITNGPFLLAHAQTGLEIILSTGMATLAEIEQALGALAFGYLGWEQPSLARFQLAYADAQGHALLKQRVTLLHCTTQYPTPPAQVNLRSMDTLRQAFGLAVGYSDHTQGLAVSLAAAARGATIIEKHFTLDRSLPGPDHIVSLEPDELQQMVAAIRVIELALGSALKSPQPEELNNRLAARKSVLARRDIMAGEVFGVENLAIKRPGLGLSPMEYWRLQGKVSQKNYQADEMIDD